MNNIKVKLPVKFEKDAGFQHPEFSKVKVFIGTYGLNRNNSNIDREAFERASNSLFNTPLIGEYSESIEDFKGHGGKIEITDEGIQYIQTTRPYGVIPESCNPRWEMTEDDEEYYVCDAIIWTERYEESKKVLENTCNQSMEINLVNYEIKDGVTNIKDFTFSALCILGEDTEPCFEGAKIVYSLNKEEFNKEFSLLLNNIKNINDKEGDNVGKEKILEKYSYLLTNAFAGIKEQYEAIVSNAEISNEELEAKLFSLSTQQISMSIREQLACRRKKKMDRWGDEYEFQEFYLIDVLPSENMAIVEDNDNYYKHYGISYSYNGDNLILDYDNAKRYVRGDWREFNEGEQEPTMNPIVQQYEKDMFEKFESKINELKESFKPLETEEYKELSAKFEALQKENEELVQFKNETLNSKRKAEEEALFGKFEELNDCEEFAELKEKASEMELDEIETKLFALLGKKSFSLKTSKGNKKENTNKIPVGFTSNNNNDGESYGGLFEKYISKK